MNIKDIERIFYWLRRYGGIRDKKEGKVWRAVDMDVLEIRIKEYIKNPKKFDFDNPDMNIDDFGLKFRNTKKRSKGR